MPARETIFWEGFCSNDRIIAMSEIEKIISTYGFILDFKQFSDISIAITIELEEANIQKLYFGLKNYLRLNDFETADSVSRKERTVFLHVTFTKGTGDLRIEIPAVPG